MSNAVEKMPEQVPAEPPHNEASTVLQVIDRIARDPKIDMDRVERFLLMQERIMAQNAKAAFVSAFAEMQTVLPIIDEKGSIKDRAGNVQSTYAKWEDLNEQIKPVLATHGFALRFRTGQEADRIVVTGILSHREGHTEEAEFRLPADTSGSKNAVQALGSSVSYGKRYTAMALLNITSRAKADRDDDGKAAGGAETINDEQVVELRELIDATESDIPRFCRFFKIEALAYLPAKRFAEAIGKLKAKGARQ